MTVAHDASSESHAGGAGSASEASFNWSHNPVGVPKGVLVFTFTNANADDATAVTYDGVALTAVAGGRAVDTAGEAGDCKAWFLGSSVPTTDPATVVVTRNNNANVMYAVCATMTAGANTERVGGIVLLQENQAVAEQAIDSGAVTAVRYAGLNSGLGPIQAAGANSTLMLGITFGARSVSTVVETTPGSGSRSVGFSAATDDVAAVHLAFAEVVGTQNLTGSLFTKAPTFPTGAITSTRALTGSLFTKAPTFFTGVVTARYNLTGTLFTKAPTFPIGVITATRALTGVLFTKAPTFPTGAVSLASSPQTLTGSLFTKAPTFFTGTVAASYALTGTLFVKAPTFFTGTVTSGTVTLTGTLFSKAPTFPQGAITTGVVSLTGVLFTKAPTFPTGTVTAGAYSLTGTLYVNTPTFPTGTIGQAGTLFGVLFVNTPVFFTGLLAQGGPSFWQPNPAGWTANPSGFVRVGRYGPSPWGAELSGQRFEKAPTFPAGAVS